MGRIYNALDRFLPFDRVLDPMFGGGQVQTAARQPQAPMVPQMAPGGGAPSVMGFSAMPPMPGPPQAPQAPQRRVPKVSPWRVLDGVLGGATVSESLDRERERPIKQQQQAQFRANLPADQQAVFDVSPELWAQYFGKPKEAQRPQRFTTPTGIVEFGEGDEPTMAYPFPEKPVAAPPAPNGYRWRSDGMGLEYIPGGPADPKTIGVGATVRRAPPRKPSGARGQTAPAARGGGFSDLPAGAVVVR